MYQEQPLQIGLKPVLQKTAKILQHNSLPSCVCVLSFLSKAIYYFQTFALVARTSTIRLLLALASIHNLVIHQMDVKMTFLNGDLDEKVYMRQSNKFIVPG